MAVHAFDETKYQRTRVHWAQEVWYGLQRDLFASSHGMRRGQVAELRAAEKSPFDFVAEKDGHRLVVDVTTKWQKRVDAKARMVHSSC